ncbi:hypothetical protein [Caballeronia sp. INSB1]|uniref:DUF7447 family protein n=1 Tax=Caballeronia sp. INSB1 TaxID=2921751 RepID=UPI0020329F07|nr:hypothetical protein [Caballeronia sp. INSB1]
MSGLIAREPMAQVEARHNGPWFSGGNKRYFGTRLPATALVIGEYSYFWSSEKNFDGTRRLYTVRRQCRESGSIETVGEFQQYASVEQAKAAIRKIAEGAT